MAMIERLSVEAGAVTSVTAAVHEPVRDADGDGLVDRPRSDEGLRVLLVPGAGGTLATPGLVALAEVLARLGATVVRANLPYREAGRRTPPRAEASVAHLTRLLASADELVGSGHWVVGGKSYGCRVASLALAGGLEANGLLCYGYPLHPPGRPDRLRTDHWPGITVPTLLLQGDRDPFCDLALLRGSVDRLAGPTTLHVVEGGDHSLRIPRAASPTGKAVTDVDAVASLEPVVGAWLRGVVGGG